MKKFITSSQAPKAVGPYSQAIVVNGFVFCSGQIALDPTSGKIESTSIEGQTEQIIANITNVLKEAGSSIENVVQAQCFLSDMQDYAKFNEAYGKYFSDSKPARYTVGVSALPLNAKVEIAVTATV